MKRVSICFVLLLVVASVRLVEARGADDWSLMTRDFHSRIVKLLDFDDEGISVIASPTTRPSKIASAEFVGLSRVETTASTAPRLILRLRDGEMIAGDPVTIDGETFRWRSPLIGVISFPMSDVADITTRRQDSAAGGFAQKPPSDDQATLNNGDVVHGVVAEITPKSISMQRPDGTTVPIALETLDRLQFAAVAATTAATTASDRGTLAVRLSEGSKLSVDHLVVHSPSVTFSTVDGIHREIPLDGVRSIEPLNGPVKWLSSSPPSENVQTPLFDRASATRFDRSVNGRPIRFGDRVFAHGIGVHAYSRLSWPISAADQTFRTQFAIDGDAPYAAVDVRIKLDGQVVSETKDVRAGVLSAVVCIDVRNAHTLTLEVEDGNNDDVQARLNWIEPALLKFTPTTTASNSAQP